MCCTCVCLSTRAFTATGYVYTYKSLTHAVLLGLQSTKNVFGLF
jgi:hypothetical protein